MVARTSDDLILLSPLERPDVGLVAAAVTAGALGVLNLGRDPARGAHALAAACGMVRELGVRVHAGVAIGELPPQVVCVIVTSADEVARFAAMTPPRRVLVQVTSEREARAAIAAGASGVIAKGCEAGGRIGDETTFVLVQRLVAALGDGVRIWAQGGIGEHTAAACIAGGAAGVVLDSQLALVRESSVPAEIQVAIGAMDGSEPRSSMVTACSRGRICRSRTSHH